MEAAPGDAEHADAAGAPGLGGEPGDDLDAVGKLLRQVLVLHQSVGLAVAADVHPHTGVAPRGGQGLYALVARRGRVALAVGDVFPAGRAGVLLGILTQPDSGTPTASSRQRTDVILNFREFPKR